MSQQSTVDPRDLPAIDIELNDPDPIADSIRLRLLDCGYPAWVELIITRRNLFGGSDTRTEILLTPPGAARIARALLTVSEAAAPERLPQ
jgi:hypothetical protein